MKKEIIKEQFDGIEFEITIYRGEHYKYNKNIISVCAFRLITNYKPNEVYLNGILDIISMIDKINWNLRIYYDESILHANNEETEIEIAKWKKLLNIALKTNKCELYKYEFKDFKKDDIYHLGVFGMMVRFMPMFNFSFEKKDTIIYISDIDYCLYKNYGNIIDEFMNSEYKMLYRSRLCYCNTYYNVIQNEMHCPIASLFILKEKLDYKIFINFLLQIKNGTGFYKSYIDKYKQENKQFLEKKIKRIPNFENIAAFKQLKNKINLIDEIGYGVDEVFLTNFIVKKLLKEKIKYMLILKLLTSFIPFWHNFRYVNHYFKNLNDKQNSTLNIFFKTMSNKLYDFVDNDHDNNFNLIATTKNYTQMLINLKFFMTNHNKLLPYINIDDNFKICANMFNKYIKNNHTPTKVLYNN